jgi:hypothetical protein
MKKLFSIIKKNKFVFILFIVNFCLSLYFTRNINLLPESYYHLLSIRLLLEKGILSMSTSPYTGINVFLIPFLIFVKNPLYYDFAMSISASFFLSLTNLLTYFLSKRYLGKKFATLLFIFVMLMPAFIFNNNSEVPFSAIFLVLFLILIHKFTRTKNNFYLMIFGVLTGYSFFFKLNNLYLFVSIFISLFLLYRKELFQYITWNNVLIFSIFFLIGFSPFLVISYNQYQTSNEIEIISLIKTNAFLTDSNYNNTKIYDNFISRIFDMYDLMFYFFPFIREDFSEFNYNAFFLLIGFFILLAKRNKLDYFILSTIMLFVFFNLFLPGNSHVYHLFLIFPLFIFVILRGFFYLLSENSKLIQFIGLIMIILFVVTNLFYIYENDKTLKSLVLYGDYVPFFNNKTYYDENKDRLLVSDLICINYISKLPDVNKSTRSLICNYDYDFKSDIEYKRIQIGKNLPKQNYFIDSQVLYIDYS